MVVRVQSTQIVQTSNSTVYTTLLKISVVITPADDSHPLRQVSPSAQDHSVLPQVPAVLPSAQDSSVLPQAVPPQPLAQDSSVLLAVLKILLHPSTDVRMIPNVLWIRSVWTTSAQTVATIMQTVVSASVSMVAAVHVPQTLNVSLVVVSITPAKTQQSLLQLHSVVMVSSRDQKNVTMATHVIAMDVQQPVS